MRAYMAMMPRIEAEQTRRLINGLLAASGRQLKDADHRGFMADLDAQAAGTFEAREVRPLRVSISRLERMGLTVIREPSKQREAVNTT